MSSNPNYPFAFVDLMSNRLPNSLDSHIQFNTDEHYNLNQKEIESIFLNPMFGVNRDSEKAESYNDNGIDYFINDYGFRSKQFTSNEDVIIAGCSHTYGIGVPESMTWGSSVASYLNLSYSNLGVPGGSVTTIVNNLFSYFKKYNNPKIILCVFPNFQRLLLPVDIDILISKNTKKYVNYKNKKMNNIVLNKRILDHSYYDNRQISSKYSKAPHDVEDVMPEIVPYWMALQSIHILEQYCDAANIKLLWSVWDWQTYNTLKLIKNTYPEYFKYMIDIKMDHWVASVQKNVTDAKPIPIEEIRKDRYHQSSIKKNDICIEDKDLYCEKVIECHKDIENQNPAIFNLGADFAHWGTHRHAHVAEIFKEELSKIL